MEGGAKGKTGRGGGGGGKTTGSSESNNVSDCVAITKDNHNSLTSSHFSRAPNGSSSFARGDHVLQLGGIPRRPFMGPAQQNGNAVHHNNNNINVNNGGNDFYLHKKFKKVTATVDVTPSTSASSSNGNSTGQSSEASGATNCAGSSTNSSSGMVYKPKFRITSDLEALETAHEEQQQQQPKATPLLSPREKASPIPATPAPEVPIMKPVTHFDNHVDNQYASNSGGGSSIYITSKHGSAVTVSPVYTSPAASSSGSSSSGEPARISKELRLDRKSLDDRISKIIVENQTLLEWPEQFTKMLKNHTTRGQSSQQRNLLSGGSTTELTSSSMPSSLLSHHNSHHNGLIRHSSSSSDMSSSGGSVELLTSSPHHQHHSLLNNVNGGCSRSVAEVMAFKHSIGEIHSFPMASSSAMAPTDLSFGAHNSATARSRSCSPVASSTISTSSTTTSSSMVPKKRRRLSPTPSRLCGGEVSELPVNEPAGGKNYFQDVDMTVRVSNCGPSGAKVTIRTNNGTNSGGSVQTGMGAPVDFSKMIDTVQSPLPNMKHPNGAMFFSSPGPSSSSSMLPGNKPLSLVSTKSEGSIMSLASVEQKPPKSPRGRPPRKKSVPETVECETTPASSSLLRFVPPPSEIPSRPKSSDPVITPKLLPPPQNPKRPTFLALKPVNTNSKKTEPGVLPSPETPRVAKPYNQMTINGQAYTYLGFKVSTRSSYTCLFKTQPMFIPQETDPKLSMYTNWQPRPRDPNQMELGISTNDSRVNGRKSPHSILYTSATGKCCDTLTVSSPDNQPPISSPICESKTFLSGIQGQIAPSVAAEAGESSSMSRNSTSSSPMPNQLQFSQPVKIHVSPPNSRGIVPISPPAPAGASTLNHSPVTFVASNNPAVGSGGLVSIASSPSPKMSCSTVSLSFRDKSRRRTSPMMSSSDTNSVDEPIASYAKGVERRRRSVRSHDDEGESNMSDGPLALTSLKGEGSKYDSGDEHGSGQSVHSGTHSSRFENRVKIMEGGFESNEDYTYVRGRGRGRYVCEACGIRCKKPSMLRKHLKTHTDLRPYTCKLCNFSFKTKGNLTKHQKSKSHHKKCAGLGIHPESSTSLAMTGPAFSISDTNTTDDNDTDDDDFDDNGDPDAETDSQDECEGDSMDGNDNGSESFEKEIAQSLLDLSKATIRLPSAGSASSDYESGGDRMKQKRPGFHFSSVIEESNSSIGSFTTGETTVPETPIDLSVKPTKAPAPTSTGYENESKRIKLEKNGLIKSVGVVREAEAWEPTEDEGCLNLKKVLNTESDSNSEAPEIRIPEVKTEVLDYATERPYFGPRQRTESETSSCSGTNSIPAMGAATTTSAEPSVVRKRLSATSPPPSQHQSGGSSSSVKLHQPWLSPSEPKDSNKKETDEVAAAPVEVKPVNIISPDIPKYNKAPSEESELPPRDVPPNTAQPPAIESGLSSVSSPNSKLFSGLSAIKPQAEFRQPSGPQALVKDEGKAECNVCGKTFARASQLTLHMNIHYIERPFRCDPCGVSFRTKGHLIKHRRSSSHDCKVYLTEAWGVANEENPRPFKCPDCKIAFRIHGHLAKHLRSKMHIMRMECLGKLPFGIYFEMEKSGINLNEIDTTDCDMSLVSLQNVARKIYGDQWRERLTAPVEEPPV
ncbi:Transcription factor HIVEP2 [Orchesella cincta]|uniref:Transcription factor HIVEP2 n=1 Tax=Orchesella cincta TaxID=48709 RepID=A0A1D2N748_ORCCI|nr:Transcription factor HIVEP2 [Orchesella cincta]